MFYLKNNVILSFVMIINTTLFLLFKKSARDERWFWTNPFLCIRNIKHTLNCFLHEHFTPFQTTYEKCLTNNNEFIWNITHKMYDRLCDRLYACSQKYFLIFSRFRGHLLYMINGHGAADLNAARTNL